MSSERLEKLLHEGARHYESGILEDAISCWRGVLQEEPGHSAAQSYLDFVLEHFELDEDAKDDEIRRAARQARSQRQAQVRGEAEILSVASAEQVAEQEAEIAQHAVENSSDATSNDLPATGVVEQQSDGLVAQTMGLNLTRLHRAGRYEEAVQIAHKILGLVPQHPMASRYIEEYQKQRGSKQAERALNDLSRVPVLQLPLGEIAYQEIDSRAGFLLSQIDGATSFEDLIQISGLSRADALRILSSLVEQGIIQ